MTGRRPLSIEESQDSHCWELELYLGKSCFVCKQLHIVLQLVKLQLQTSPQEKRETLSREKTGEPTKAFPIWKLLKLGRLTLSKEPRTPRAPHAVASAKFPTSLGGEEGCPSSLLPAQGTTSLRATGVVLGGNQAARSTPGTCSSQQP